MNRTECGITPDGDATIAAASSQTCEHVWKTIACTRGTCVSVRVALAALRRALCRGTLPARCQVVAAATIMR